MSLYDTIQCLYPLPCPEHQALEFQTKNLDCAMQAYTVTKPGRLIRHLREYEIVPEEDRPNWGKPEWDTTFGPMLGMMRVVTETDVDEQHHGWMTIYSKDQADQWVEYQLKFTDGWLVEVKGLSESVS